MKNMIKVLTVLSVFLLTGCLGPEASWSENLQDNFIGTSARSTNERLCFTLTKEYTFTSGSTTFVVPAGRYVSTQKIDSGHFYKAPSRISSSNFLAAIAQDGIYLNNQLSAGNLYGPNPQGIDWSRPIRGAVIPSQMFAYIKNHGKC